MFKQWSLFFRHISSVVSFFQLPNEKRRIVFYSEGKAYWVHLAALLEQTLAADQVDVCYISSDEHDPGLSVQHPRLLTFKIDEGWVRNWLFENIETEVMVMTMPDLHQYQVKKSRFPVNYVYTQHSMVSLHMVYRPGAFDHFDTVFCSGPHHVAEMRAIEARDELAPKTLVEHGYPRLDSILANSSVVVRSTSATDNVEVLLAPSWGKHSITDTVAMELIGIVLAAGFRLTYRPHPQSQKFSADKIDEIVASYGCHDSFEIEFDVSSEDSLHRSQLMICDWSGAALDYAFGLGKPVVFIDVPKKVNDPAYLAIAVEPFEVSIRKRIGCVLEVEELRGLPEKITQLLNRDMSDEIMKIRNECIFNVGCSGEAGAQDLLNLLSRK
ncbi:MAG: hypothetical protein ACI9KM_001879 [Rubritalea sp.]|jgi:hypothetical protein